MPDSFPDAGEIRFRKHRDAGSVLNAALVLIRRNAREMIGSYLAIVAPIAAASGLASVLFVSQVSDLLADPQAILADPTRLFGPSYVSSLVLSMLSWVVAQAAAGGYVRLYREGQAGAITPGGLWEETRGLVLPILGMSLLFFLAVAGVGIINVVPCLGQIAWLAFLFWAGPIFAVAIAARAVETATVAEAWTRARELVKDSWGFTFGALFLAGVVTLMLAIAVGALSGLLGALLGVGVGFDPTTSTIPQVTTASAVLQAVVQVLSFVIYLVPFLAAYFVHGRLVEETDGTGLHDDLDVLADAGFATPGFQEPPARPTPPASTPPAAPPPLPPRPDAPDDADDAPPSGFRGGGFGA